jgi:hypothetical protein
VLSSLVHRSKAICDSTRLLEELKFLLQIFWDIGQSEWQVVWSLGLPKRAPLQCR